MSIFGSIVSKIFPSHHPAVVANTNPESPTAPAAAPASVSAPAGASAAPVDVNAVLTQMAQQHDGALNWQSSIVDLLKLLGLDSSLSARKELAKELQFSGDTNDSAAMNLWLHRRVMEKLAENGGRVPSDLLH